MPSVRSLQALLGVMISGAVLAIYMSIMTSPVSLEAAPPTTPIACTSSVPVTGASAATTELVALSAGKRVYVCGFVLNGAGATTATLKYGTGTACGSGTTSLTGALKFVDGTTIAYGGGVGYVAKTPAGNALCWTNSGSIQVSGLVTYTQY